MEEKVSVLLHLNARLQPLHRGEVFEDLIDEVLKTYGLGEVTGGGSLVEQTGEIKSCDIEMSVKRSALERLLSWLGKIDLIPRGSWVEADGERAGIGSAEGLALYLNGTDLPREVYESCDVNELIGTLDSLLEGVGQRLSHWEGGTETALYFYGTSYEEMREKTEPLVSSHPLCEQCRMVRIA